MSSKSSGSIRKSFSHRSWRRTGTALPSTDRSQYLLVNRPNQPSVGRPIKGARKLANAPPLSSNGQPATRSRIPNQLDPDAHSENRQENTHQIGLLPKPTGESRQQRCKKQPGPDRSLVNRSRGHSSRWHFHGYFIDVPRQRLGTCASDGRFSPHSDSQSWWNGG